MDKNSKIYVAGHKGLVGSAITRHLIKSGYKNLILRGSDELDLIDQKATEFFFQQEKPEFVFCAAAKVGGIFANKTQKADFIYKNIQVQNNLIHFSYQYNVQKLLFLGSSCIYPRECQQPIKEEYLLSGPLEETNDAYAVAKIAGIKMCQSYDEQYGTNFISVMPTNLYGINDNFNLESAHVLPALLRRFHEATINHDNNVTVWGTGRAKREFLFVDDLAEALVYLMNSYDDKDIVNIGTGEDCTIKQLVEMIKETVGYKGNVEWDTTKPDGTPQKLLDVSKLHKLGWKHKIDLKQGLALTFDWYKNNFKHVRK